MTAPLAVEDGARTQDAQQPRSHVANVTPDFFPVMDIRLVSGRWFDERDAEGAAPVAIINEALARELFPGQNPIGKGARSFLGSQTMREIVGVVTDVRQISLAEPATPVFYAPMAQEPRAFFTLLVRSELTPAATINAVRTAVRAVDPELAVGDIATMRELIRVSVANPRFLAWLVGIFASVSLALTLAGVYAVMASGVAERRREIGVRLALGAQPSQVRGMIAREALGLAVVGLAIGFPLAIAAARSLRALLFGVTATDLLSFLLAGAALLIAAAAGTLLPAWRAARVNPVELDASVNRYLERWRVSDGEHSADDVTVPRLLSHTAGLNVPRIAGAQTGSRI
jgi:predicted permease